MADTEPRQAEEECRTLFDKLVLAHTREGRQQKINRLCKSDQVKVIMTDSSWTDYWNINIPRGRIYSDAEARTFERALCLKIPYIKLVEVKEAIDYIAISGTFNPDMSKLYLLINTIKRLRNNKNGVSAKQKRHARVKKMVNDTQDPDERWDICCDLLQYDEIEDMLKYCGTLPGGASDHRSAVRAAVGKVAGAVTDKPEGV